MSPGCRLGEPPIRGTGGEHAGSEGHHCRSHLRYKISARHKPLKRMKIPNPPQILRYKISGVINLLF